MSDEHRPGRIVLQGEVWNIQCVCGDEWCSVDWDLSPKDGQYFLEIPAGVDRKDIPFLMENW